MGRSIAHSSAEVGTVPDAVMGGALASGVEEAEMMVTVHEDPVIVVLMEPPIGPSVEAAGHQQEGPGPASPPRQQKKSA